MIICGMQLHIAHSVCVATPKTVLETTNTVEEIDQVLRAAQQNYFVGDMSRGQIGNTKPTHEQRKNRN